MILSPLLAAALLAPVPLQSRPGAPPLAQATSPETAEGVEILRRVLIDALDQVFQEKPGRDRVLLHPGTPAEGLVTTLWAGGQTVQHARAFHLPGAGLFFALDVSLPVIKKEAEEPGSDQPQDDEWERARQTVRGTQVLDGIQVRGLRLRSRSSTGEIDPQAIEQTTDLVLRTLARHVARIEGLGSNETVTVALRLSGRDRSWLHEWSSEEPEGAGKPDGEGHVELEAKSFSGYFLATGQEVRQQNLVLQIALADLARAEAATPAELRRAARVNRY